MSQFTVFDSTSGEILSNIDVESSDIAANVEAGEDYISGFYLRDEYYISDPGGTQTPTLKVDPTITWDVITIDGDSIDAATATGIPNPSDVFYDVQFMQGVQSIADNTITDGTIVYTSAGYGTMIVVIDAGITYLLHEQEITVNSV